MRLLDLYCGAGGAAMGYYRSGFTEIVGIDIKSQSRYPFDFIQADALVPPLDVSQFDLIHASPPCQAFTRARSLQGNSHPNLIPATREILRQSGVPYVIENVPGAPLINPIAINGPLVGLDYIGRERWFESSLPLPSVLLPRPRSAVKMGRPVKDGDVISVVGHFSNVPYARKAMGIDWMSQAELAQAIPPAYTEWIGEKIISQLR